MTSSMEELLGGLLGGSGGQRGLAATVDGALGATAG
jgi:hypothetical protein